MEEVWKDIEMFNGNYQVSSIGNVRTMARKMNMPKGGVRNIKSAILKLGHNQRGYPMVYLSYNCKQYSLSVHRLVAKAFIPNIENKREVNHKNGIKTDNKVENLEWCTSSENSFHAYKIGLKKGQKGNDNYFKNHLFRGENSYRAKLILDTSTGIFYYGAREAANAKGLSSRNLWKKMNIRKVNSTTLIYV